MRDKNEGKYQGGEGNTRVTTACVLPKRSLRVKVLTMGTE